MEVNALIDSGSMVTTVSESFYHSIENRPPIQDLQILLDISVADGSKLNYLGYIDTTVSVPFLADFSLPAPVLVVPDTHFNGKCPVIVGTNVIRPLRQFTSDSRSVPPEWQLAMDCLKVDHFTVKACSRKPISVEPYQTVIVNGFTRNVDSSVTDVVTENVSSSFAVCPRVVKLQKFDYCRIPVKICNMSAKPLTIRPRSAICQISEVKVVDNLASDSQPSVSTCSSPSPLEELGVKIDRSLLTDDQYLRVQQVPCKWGSYLL